MPVLSFINATCKLYMIPFCWNDVLETEQHGYRQNERERDGERERERKRESKRTKI